MTTTTVLNAIFGSTTSDAVTDRELSSIKGRAAWNSRLFGEEQIRSLVQQLFLRGGLRSSRQVVFSCVDENSDIADICQQVGHSLSAEIAGSVCIVEVAAQPRCDEDSFQIPISHIEGLDCLRDSALCVSKNLWLMPWDVFLRDQKALSAGWLRSRLDELRLAFDYTIFQAPPAGQFSDPLLLGHLCDGVVLVLTASFTRRVSARKVKERLYSANARLLGTVLSGRTFPIPDRIYKRL
jgi:hypothetical protein